MTPEILALIMFVVTFGLIFKGYPVSYSLGGSALVFFLIGLCFNFFSVNLLRLIPSRIFGIMTNNLLLAIPYFVFMGNIMENSGLASDMLKNISNLFGKIRGGLGFTVIIVGALLAASTSIVAASVITMSIISLPLMLKAGYTKEYSTGVIVASGTLGQIVPPSIVLIILADQMGISVGDLFKGAMIPALILIILYLIYTIILGIVKPQELPINNAIDTNYKDLIKKAFTSSLPPLILIVVVLGSILLGIATVTEAGALGVIGAYILARIKKRIKITSVFDGAKKTVVTVSMVMFLLIGATVFTLVFRALGGDVFLENMLVNLPGGKIGLIVFSSLFIFVLGFFIDFFEIIFIVVPLLTPAANVLGIDLVWFAIIISMNLQTSFLTPPFGFSIFFLKNVAPPEIETKQIYNGVIPFVVLQIICLIIIYLFPELVTF